MFLRAAAFSSPTGRLSHAPGRSVKGSTARRAVALCSSHNDSHKILETENAAQINRRSLLLASGTAIGVAPWRIAVASEEASPSETRSPSVAAAVAAPSTYIDPQDGFTVTVPAGWVFGEGAISGNSSFSGSSGARRTLAWFPEDANPRDVNVTLVITNVSVEFTKLGSFGTAFQFGSTLVNSQDRSYLLRGPEWARGKEPIQIAKLIDAVEVSNRYYVEYTIQKLPEPQRHLYSVLALGFNGTYNRLYTITGQTLEADRPKYEATLLSMVKSLSVPAQRF